MNAPSSTRLETLILRAPVRAELSLSAEELAEVAGISAARLAGLVRMGLVEPDAPDGARFSAAAAARLRRMTRLHTDVGVSMVGAAIIADLLERLDRLEAAQSGTRSGSGP